MNDILWKAAIRESGLLDLMYAHVLSARGDQNPGSTAYMNIVLNMFAGDFVGAAGNVYHTVEFTGDMSVREFVARIAEMVMPYVLALVHHATVYVQARLTRDKDAHDEIVELGILRSTVAGLILQMLWGYMAATGNNPSRHKVVLLVESTVFGVDNNAFEKSLMAALNIDDEEMEEFKRLVGDMLDEWR